MVKELPKFLRDIIIKQYFNGKNYYRPIAMTSNITVNAIGLILVITRWVHHARFYKVLTDQ